MKYPTIMVGLMVLVMGCVDETAVRDDMRTKDQDPVIVNDTNNSLQTQLTKSYSEDATVNLTNPDRGFYKATYALDNLYSYNPYESAKEDGYSLVYARINLADYNETTVLPDELLTAVQTNFSQAQSAGVKFVFRIKYRGGDTVDISRSILEAHLAQLKPLLQQYKDVVSVVQAGIIGAYGEWHSFTGEYADSDANYIDNRRAVIQSLNDIFPQKFIQIRTTMHKELLFGNSTYYKEASNTAQLTQETAAEDTLLARVGHHNDCFLASSSDMGTFASNNIEYWKSYMENDSKFAPTGGETCAVGTGEDEILSSCANALSDLKRFRYSFLNDSYNLDVLQKWKDEGCYEEIKADLGYRFVANTLEVQTSPLKMNVLLSIQNRGYAAPHIHYPVSFTLSDSNNSYTFEFANFDMRSFGPLDTQSLTFPFDITNVEKGNYCLSMKIGEGSSTVKLSNSGLWDETTKSNVLACEIDI
jgi:hypothetical protein